MKKRTRHNYRASLHPSCLSDSSQRIEFRRSAPECPFQSATQPHSVENLETPCNLAGTHNQEHSCHQELRFNLDDPGNLDICYIQPEYQHQTTLYSLQHRKAVKFNATHQRAGAIRVDFKTDPTAGSVACDCYPISPFWNTESAQLSRT